MSEIGRETKKPKCKGLLKKMKTVKFVKYLNFVLDSTRQLSMLSQQFQKEDSLTIDVMEEVETASLHLMEFKLASDPKVREFENTYGAEHKTHRGITLSDTQQPHQIDRPVDAVPISAEFCKIIDNTLEYIGNVSKIVHTQYHSVISKHSTCASGCLPLKSSKFVVYRWKDIMELVQFYGLSTGETDEADTAWAQTVAETQNSYQPSSWR